MKYDFIIVGAGLAGGVLARKLAEKNYRVLIVERRGHIAGNTYDFNGEHNIKLQKYGPHTLHTNDDSVYKFITRFCEPVPYKTKCQAVVDGINTPTPFNFKTIDQFYSTDEAEALKKILREYYGGRNSVTVVELLNSDEPKIKSFAEFLFEKDYRPYTSKQWGIAPEKIDPSVLKRVPVVLSYGDTYFYDTYEFMPAEGFTAMYKNLTGHENINIITKINALDHISFNHENILYDGEIVNIIYTGAVDELFNYRFGILPYRSLEFVYKYLNVRSFQEVAIVAHPQVKDFTRITEYSKLPEQDCGGWTCVAYEYSGAYDKNSDRFNEPYYPVLTNESQKIYEQYKNYSERFKNLTLCERLADFKYYNMDQVILRALKIFQDKWEI